MVTIRKAIFPVVNSMDRRNRGLVLAYLYYGRDIDKHITQDGELLYPFLEQLGIRATPDLIASLMNNAFISGFGIMDMISGKECNYGLQLDYTINKILTKVFNKSRPFFKHDKETFKGVLERERWIVDSFIERFWQGLSEEDKANIIKGLEGELKKAGISDEALFKLMSGSHFSLTVLRSVLGFKFHIFLASFSNMISKIIFGRGLSLGANAALQRFAASIFGGPVGWTIAIASIGSLVAGLVNPREWDKYIPAVFLIGLYRVSHTDNSTAPHL